MAVSHYALNRFRHIADPDDALDMAYDWDHGDFDYEDPEFDFAEPPVGCAPSPYDGTEQE